MRFYPKALEEMEQIYDYIAYEKLSADVALEQTRRIKMKVLSLNTFPQRHQERLEGQYANRGYRQLLIDNYMAIYKIDEDKKYVDVITW